MLIIVMVWIQAGFAMTVLSAAIKAIPDEIIEAAKLDGVRRSRCSATSRCRASGPPSSSS
jgi:ABC-type sugar transport system permease subunit